MQIIAHPTGSQCNYKFAEKQTLNHVIKEQLHFNEK